MAAGAREERLRIDELRQELERLASQESKLPPEQQKLSSALAQHRAVVSQREKACESSLAAKEQKLAELQKGCTMYGSRLGLAFERVGEERLRLTFTNIDPASPMRAFSFQVFVDAGALPRPRRFPGLASPCARCRSRLAPARPPLHRAPPAPPPAADKYHVESCEPTVPQLDALLASLNKGNDFSRFVRDMRKQFKSLVA